MLITPLGKLSVYKNNEPITYSTKKLSLKPIEICNYEVDERYLIEIDISNIDEGDIITYIINTNIDCEEDGGDCLVEAMFESDELFLAIGGYDINNGNHDIYCGYTFSVIRKGLKAEIKDLKYIEDYSVAIAWSTTSKEDFYTAVWFGADPYI